VITDRARFRCIKKLQQATKYRLPECAFHPANLEFVTNSVNIDNLDPGTRDQILHFYKDFLECNCRNAPFCGCPERKFVITILELREIGLNHKEIHNHLLDEYGIDLFPADVLSFLENSVHLLEAVRSIADLAERKKLVELSNKHINKIAR
jgi:superfamily II helicase